MEENKERQERLIEAAQPIAEAVASRMEEFLQPLRERIEELERQVAELRDEREITRPDDAPR